MTKDNGNYGDPNWWRNSPQAALRHHASGAVERGEAEPIVEQPVNHAEANAKGWLESILEMVTELGAHESCTTAWDDAEQRIHESVLSVMVRDGWRMVGVKSDGPVEYEILLTTGGPALRIIGTLGPHDEPDDWPRLEYQDWGTPWTEYIPAREHREALQKFASVFYYGDG